MYLDAFQKIGLAKNEARIYETLLKEGSSGVGHIATKSEVHRRNVYDSLNRLMEKGLVSEIVQSKENLYQAVDPHKLIDMLDEKREIVNKILPELDALYKTNPAEHSIHIYRGKEGWKNYMRDMLHVGEPVYFIAAKGGWLDKRVRDFFPTFIKEAKKKKLKYYHLFDYEVKTNMSKILNYVGKDYKFLPKEYSTPSAVDIFGDRVNIVTEIKHGELGEEIVFSVIINKNIADSFRTWFQFMWNSLPRSTNMQTKKPATTQKKDF